MLRIVTTEAQAETFIQGATFKNFKIISKNLVSVSLRASSVVWNKPTPVSATILDLSKLSLYKFHYEEMFPRYGSDRLKVVYKHTDSLLYRIKTADFNGDMSTFKHLLDLSDYPEDHFLHDKTNKKVPLTMTDELDGKVLKEIVCLRSNYTALIIWLELNRALKVFRNPSKKIHITVSSRTAYSQNLFHVKK